MKVFLFSVVAFLQVTGSYSFDPTCPFPPDLWCSSYDIASACGVTEQCSGTEWSPVVEKAPVVNLSLYYECECGGCQDIILNQIWPAFNSIGDIFSLTLIPYGNSQERKDGDKWVFSCLHGNDECMGNTFATCTINILNGSEAALPFIKCMEVHLAKTRPSFTAFELCAKSFSNIPKSKIIECVLGDQGNKWQHEMALKTEALNPPIGYTPWVVLNGEMYRFITF